MEPLRIGLLGLGVVGSAVANALIDKGDFLTRRIGRPLELTRVLVNDPGKPRPIDRSLITLNPAEILENPAIDVVVEVIPAENPAHEYIVRALQSGKHVVTANKEVMAKHGPEILSIA